MQPRRVGVPERARIRQVIGAIRVEARFWQSGQRKRYEPLIPKLHGAFLGHYQQPAFRTARQTFYTVTRQSVFDCIGSEIPVVKSGESTVISTYPQIVVDVLKECVEAVAVDALCVASAEDGEAYSIKANKPIKRGEPEITIICLEN